jgi:hypothetical protein
MTVFIVVGSVFVLLALGCGQGIFHWLRKAHVTSRWPTVPGKVTSSWEVLNGERVKYDYAVNGKRYVGHQVSWGPRGGTAEPTYQELAEKYPPGREVTRPQASCDRGARAAQHAQRCDIRSLHRGVRSLRRGVSRRRAGARQLRPIRKISDRHCERSEAIQTGLRPAAQWNGGIMERGRTSPAPN